MKQNPYAPPEKLRSSNDEIADFPFANKKTSTTGITNSAKNATDNGINILLTSVWFNPFTISGINK